jgi:hypothetical protein
VPYEFWTTISAQQFAPAIEGDATANQYTALFTSHGYTAGQTGERYNQRLKAAERMPDRQRPTNTLAVVQPELPAVRLDQASLGDRVVHRR